MKITTFDPMILTPKQDEVVAVFEALGFEKTHTPVTQTETGEVPMIRMKNPDGFHVDVAAPQNLPQDMIVVRMNVDDFDAAYEILTARGFKNTRGDNTLETKSAKAATMVSPSGLTISLIEHKKNRD